jgi:hypothetical protein
MLKGYKVTDLNRIGDLTNFVSRNFDSVAIGMAEVVNVLRQVRTGLALARTDIENDSLKAYTTTNRPTNTKNLNTLIVNTTTNKLNHTIDGGTIWYNADGTVA